MVLGGGFGEHGCGEGQATAGAAVLVDGGECGDDCWPNNAVAMWELVPAPELTIAKGAEGHLVLTWQHPTSGSPFTLQQSGDLSAGDWADVTVTTPGRHEVAEPEGTVFYRLREP